MYIAIPFSLDDATRMNLQEAHFRLKMINVIAMSIVWSEVQFTVCDFGF